MFGLLRGSSCKLEPVERQAWLGHLCGLCLALRDNYGQVTRIFTNYDAALLSVLCDAQIPLPQAKYSSNCPLRRNFKADVIAPSTPGAQYAASIALVMASTRIQDHVADGETFLCRVPGLASRITNRWLQAAQKATDEQGFDVDTIVTQVRRQPILEAQPGQSFQFYSRPTELATGAAFRHTAYIAGRPQNADILFQMGRMFGRIMYLLDSFLDLTADQENNRFNPLVTCFEEVDRKRKARQIFHQACRTLRDYFDQLDLPRPTLARKLLNHHLQDRGLQILAVHTGIAGDGHHPGLAYDLSRPVRLSAGVEGESDSEEESEPDEDEFQQSSCWKDFCDGFYCGGGSGDCGDGDCGDTDCGDCGDGDCGGTDCGGADCGGADCG